MNQENNLTLIQMNDSHAYLEPHSELFWDRTQPIIREAGGYARIGQLVNRIREEDGNQVIFLDNGDTVHGTYAAVTSKGEALIPILNKMEIDALTMHWEFAYGPAQLKKIAGTLYFPLLACNIYNKNSEELSYAPYEIFERNGLKIGVIGIANRIVGITMPNDFSKGIRFTTGMEELPVQITSLRKEEHVDLVVVLSHLGFPHANYIAERIDGIDVFLSGHTHNRIRTPIIVNDTIIIQSGHQGAFIGRLDLEIKDKRVKAFKHRLIEINDSIPHDEAIEEEIEKVMEPHREVLNEEVGETSTLLSRFGVLETTMDNFLLQSFLHASGLELAFSNGWRYGAPVNRGIIRMEDLWNIIPSNPRLSVCKITGEQLLLMMEDNLESTFSCHPFNQMGGYMKRCGGLNIHFKIENPNGHRIEDAYVGGRRLERSEIYHACFVTKQGIPEQYGFDKEELDITAIEALKTYLDSIDKVKSELHGSIVAI